jgi:hypothetical protein
MKKFICCSTLITLLQLLLTAPCFAQSPSATGDQGCGQLITIDTHDSSATRYAFLAPSDHGLANASITLVLLAGGSGYVDLDDKACPRALKGNALIRMIPLFSELGFATALVDAPSDYHSVDGLGGFRIANQHAQDLGKIIADLRTRTQGAVWLISTSRGTISAVNAASRLSNPSAPDGVVLASALMFGQNGARISWVAQSVFDLPLEDIHIPLLVLGHARDNCIRSPAHLMGNILARTKSPRQQMHTVTGGPGGQGPESVSACEGRSPHGYIGQEKEVAGGIAQFVRGGSYPPSPVDSQ